MILESTTGKNWEGGDSNYPYDLFYVHSVSLNSENLFSKSKRLTKQLITECHKYRILIKSNHHDVLMLQ